MSNQKLQGKKIAVLATNGFEQSELFDPYNALKEAGADVHIVSLESGSIKGWDKDDWGKSIDVDKTLDSVSADDYNGLMLPGGVMNPDTLRAEDKPVAAICHAPQLLIEADVVKGRKLTSYNSIKTDLINAGAQWEDSEVVTDQGFVTSRNPNDLPAFIDKMIEEFREGKHDRQHA